MSLLSWRATDGRSGQWEVQSGSRRIGRAEGNDCVLPDASVSSIHAEATLEGDHLLLRDLDSTNGSFVNGERVREALIEPGGSFRLGDVEVTFSPRASEAAIPIPSIRISGAGRAVAVPEPAPTALARGVCWQHPASPAAYTCTRCAKDLCSQCAKAERVGGKNVVFCRSCGGKCVPFGQPISTAPAVRPKFAQMLPSAFAYPFKGNGLILLITGTIFFGLLDLLANSRITMASLPALFLRIIMYGYLFAYMQKIIGASANAEDEPPTWPEVTEIYQDIFQPFFLFLGVVLACFLPGIVLAISSPLGGLGLMMAGAIYFPMAVLAVAMADSLGGLSPTVVVPSILKVPGQYAVAVLLCGVLVFVRGVLPSFLNQMGIPLVPGLLLNLCALYLIMVEMRILGLLYYTNSEKLGWF